MRIDDLKQEIRARQKEIDSPEEEARFQERSGPEYTLAIALHKSLCTLNHTDGCSWHYEMENSRHDWGGYSHVHYLEKARKLLKDTGLNPADVITVVEHLK